MNLKRCFIFAIPILLTAVAAFGASRSIVRDTDKSGDKIDQPGVFYALMIGVGDYNDPAIPDLKTSVNDAQVLGNILERRYDFKTQYLLNRQADWASIDRELRKLARITSPEDSVLIYYAGRGERDNQYDEDWWIPADARAGDTRTFIGNSVLQKTMRSIKARHVLLIADSCYAGALLGIRNSEMPAARTDQYYMKLFNAKSRQGIISGGDEPFIEPGAGHSVFAFRLIQTLQRNMQPYLSATELFELIAPVVINKTGQKPKCLPIRNTGGKDGEFVFIAAIPRIAPTPIPAPSKEETAQIATKPVKYEVAIIAKPQKTASVKRRTLKNSLGMQFVYIPPGTFMMGSPPDEPNRNNDENRHKVILTKGFYMQTTEVTQWQWKAVMGDNPSFFKNCGDNCPVERVAWREVQEFIKKLNDREGTDTHRLPTEAEWEYACRAGAQTPFAFGRCLSTEQGNYAGSLPMPGCSKGATLNKTIPVASLQPNDFGLYDMHGNVKEWCKDIYGNYPSGAVTDPQGLSSGSDQVVRGGSCYSDFAGCRSAVRTVNSHSIIYNDLGFRLLKTP